MTPATPKLFPSVTEQHRRLRDAIWARLGRWRPFVVAIDGVDMAGKSTLARYLAWQLGMPAIETDLYLVTGAGALRYREQDLRAAIKGRLKLDRPTIVEGVAVLSTLRAVQIEPDFLVWTEQDGWGGSNGLAAELAAYIASHAPRSRADFIFRRPPDPDAAE